MSAKKALPLLEEVSQARQILRQSVPQAAQKLVGLMISGDKEDAVQLQASKDILSINGIAPHKESGDASAKLVGTAVVAALVGMARVMGMGGVTQDTFKKALPSPDPVSLPPELLEDQDALS